jgi:hypothetical protein
MEIYVMIGEDEIEVPIEPQYELIDDSYHDEYGLVKFPKYIECMGFEFDKDNYSESEAAIIETYISDNFGWLSQRAVDNYQEDTPY